MAGAFVDGLGRRDLLLRGSPFWRCGKCDCDRNFSNRQKCHQCGQRPPQWILDAQSAKVRELAKAGGRGGASKAAGSSSGGGAPQSGSGAANSDKADKKEIERLRAELAAYKKADAPKGKTVTFEDTPDSAPAAADAKDAEYQRMLDDIEGQIATLRKAAKDSVDSSVINEAVEKLEAKAAAVRSERRSAWSVPRLLDRHRARVTERVGRVEKAQERVEELEDELARIGAELAEAKAHLAAKIEDLEAERKEVQKLEAQMPSATGVGTAERPAAEKAPTIDLESPGVEQQILDGLRRMAATRGGIWQEMLAAAQKQESEDQNKDQTMEGPPEGQNAVVPAAATVQASTSPGGTFALVPALAKRGAEDVAAAEGDRNKTQRRG